MQFVLLEFEVNPAGHLIHEDEFAFEYVPASHSIHEENPFSE